MQISCQIYFSVMLSRVHQAAEGDDGLYGYCAAETEIDSLLGTAPFGSPFLMELLANAKLLIVACMITTGFIG